MAAKKFGTFGGVFTPSILTILGVIMYLRLPSIVGQVGLWMTIGIIVVAHVISITTGLSVASIATDKKVQAGGTYYMISRSLGLPMGGTLGLALFVGLSFSVSLYVIGFSESFLAYWGWEVSKNTIRIVGSITLVTVTVVTLISTALALKMQFFIMAAIVLSLLSVFFGQHEFVPDAPILESLPTALPFIVLFGIFFPAVTGFEAGVSMSGDLQNPKESIPKGTIWAIAVGLIVYIGMAAFFSFTVNADQLVNNPNILLDISFFAPVVIAGIWGATISSALGSILGAPRILQATAADQITPRFFARGYGKENEPRNALILTFLLAEVGILIGELDVIARVVSMFFITTYGFLNLSCFVESWASPDFRPEFKIPKSVSLVGSIACFVVMIQLDFVAMIAASGLLGLIFLYLKRKELTLESGDTWEGFWSSLVRAGLQRLSQTDVHERNWRLNILLFSAGTKARSHMINLGQWLIYRRGLLSNFDLIENKNAKRLLPKSAQSIEAEEEVEVGIFSRRLECPDVYDAMASISTYYGFSGVEPNAIIMGWARNSRNPDRFIELIQKFTELDLSLLLLQPDDVAGFGEHASIDVWWRGEHNNISLTLALVRFLTSTDVWSKARIRFLLINESDTAHSDAMVSRINGILETFRISAQTRVINNVVGKKPVHKIIGYESAKTNLTIIGMPKIIGQNAASYMRDIDQLIEGLGTVLLIKASSFFNELSIGIETSASAAPAQIKGTLAEELPELVYPENETLRWALERFCGELESITKDFVTNPLAALYNIHHELAVRVIDNIERSADTIERMLDVEDRPRSIKALQRIQSTLLFQVRAAFTEFEENQLVQQEKLLDTALLNQRSQLRGLIRKTPEDLKLVKKEVPEKDGKETGAKVSLLSRFKNRPRNVKFRIPIEAEIFGLYQQVFAEALESFGKTTHVLCESLQKQIRNTTDGLHRMEKALRLSGDLPAVIGEESEKSKSEVQQILDDFELAREVNGRRTQLGTRKFLQMLVQKVGQL